MKCTNCGSDKVIQVSNKKDHLYCHACKHAFTINQPNKEGTLHFEGLPQAKFLMDLVLQNQNIDPVNRAGIVSQIVATLYDQWFEGFKTGLLADIVHQKDKEHGKDSFGPEGQDREHSSGDQQPSVGSDQDSGPGGQAPSAPGGIRRVKERISGIEIYRPAHIPIKEEHVEKIAEMIFKDSGLTIKNMETDGVVLKVNYYLH